jgi:hypothetical protein
MIDGLKLRQMMFGWITTVILKRGAAAPLGALKNTRGVANFLTLGLCTYKS